MTPRPAATVLVVRPAAGGPEVLMVERPARGYFGGLWVFPGGAVDPVDDSALARRVVLVPDGCDDPTWRAAALRETAEEVGLGLSDAALLGPFAGTGRVLYEELDRGGARLDGRRLRLVSNWITPQGSPVRFDTRFYLTVVDGDPVLEPQAGEVMDISWARPGDALARFERGEWALVTPTIHHLRWMATFDQTETMWAAAGTASAPPVTPSFEPDGSEVRLRLPIGAELP